MTRRLFWFVSGAVAGVSIVVWAKRTMVTVSEKLTPANIADAIAVGLRQSVMALFDGVMSLIDKYRNRQAADSASSSSAPSSSGAPTRRHNPPRQRTSHR